MLKSNIEVTLRVANFGGGITFNLEWGKFPAGEVYLKTSLPREIVEAEVSCELFCSDSFMALQMVKDVLDRAGCRKASLDLPYVPYGRQDRVVGDSAVNSSLSLKVFCQQLNSLGFDEVKIFEPHSDVTASLINNVRVFQVSSLDLNEANIMHPDLVLLCPDQGAHKRTVALQQSAYKVFGYKLPIIFARKERNITTGEISGTVVDTCLEDLRTKEVLVFDDICDGGRTFVEIGKEFKRLHPHTPMHLYVAHGLFTKGKEELYTYFSTVKALHDYSIQGETK